MSLPDNIRDRLREHLWQAADQIDWLALGPSEKSQYYENWAKDPKIGVVLSRYMDVRQVRVYIKDTLLKSYHRARQADSTKPLRMLRLPADVAVSRVFIKPHGRQLADGRIICWGRASDWKVILMAVHERSFATKGARPYAVVLTQSTGRFADQGVRAVVADAAKKLGIEKLLWDS
jgi:hypothetical protein